MRYQNWVLYGVGDELTAYYHPVYNDAHIYSSDGDIFILNNNTLWKINPSNPSSTIEIGSLPDSIKCYETICKKYFNNILNYCYTNNSNYVDSLNLYTDNIYQAIEKVELIKKLDQ